MMARKETQGFFSGKEAWQRGTSPSCLFLLLVHPLVILVATFFRIGKTAHMKKGDAATLMNQPRAKHFATSYFNFSRNMLI